MKGAKGQALIEAITAIGIMVVGVLGALAFLSNSVSLNRLVTDNYAASYLAAGIMEEYKHCIDVNGFTADCVGLLGARGILTSENLNGAEFLKTLSMEDKGNYRVPKATVSWLEKGRLFKVELEDRFYDWR